MKQYIAITLASVLLFNIALLVVLDIRDAFSDKHIILPDSPNLTTEVEETLAEMRTDDTFAYEAFIGWQAWEQRGARITIDKEGIRQTIDTPEHFGEEILLFGGSTMWGWGVGDENTIASHLQRLFPHKKVVNLGEISYNATQGLNRLLLELTKRPHPKATVVFYDGINEVLNSCQWQNGPYGHQMVADIRKALDVQRRSRVVGLLDDLFLSQIRKVAQRVKSRLAPVPASACAADPVWAEQVAKRLVTTWEAAAAIAAARGFGFRAILQPTPFSDDSVEHRFRDDFLEAGAKTVFPKVVALARKQSWFVDGSKWFAGRDPYVDGCCHVNGADNGVLALRISELIAP